MIKRLANKLTGRSTAKKAAEAKKTTVKVTDGVTAKTKRTVTKRKVNVDDLFGKIGAKAYELWEKDGCNHGNDQNYWFEAEKIVLKTTKK